MGKRAGFTLVELLVVIAILGILAATAMPAYKTWLSRTYGSEASLMMKSLVDGQIMYYLENNTFFPPNNDVYEVYAAGGSVPVSIDGKPLRQKIMEELHILIPIGGQLDYIISVDRSTPGDEKAIIIIQAEFPLYKEGNYLMGQVSKNGQVWLSVD
ncbi:MAG: prepilin-type N-terminal cleavage/methylation domain-containing protein [Deltaproteobacteria bacterium]|nr:MAG: prepilin-type N-terminal cleavage/methylation domain-containing protein [Deltaproteobacteria bacterium]